MVGAAVAIVVLVVLAGAQLGRVAGRFTPAVRRVILDQVPVVVLLVAAGGRTARGILLGGVPGPLASRVVQVGVTIAVVVLPVGAVRIR